MTLNFQIGGSQVETGLVRAWYELTLNGIAQTAIAIDGATSKVRAELDTGKTIEIRRNGTLELKAEVQQIKNLQGGGTLVRGKGIEIELAETKASVTAGSNKKTYTSTDAQTIFSEQVNSVTGWTADTSNSTSDTLNSFRVTDSQSVWNVIMNILEHTNKDIKIDYANKTVELHDSKGDSNVFAFQEDRNISDVAFTKDRAEASKVVVYGKSDGTNQIKGSAGTGTPIKEIIDRNILTSTQADTRAQKELDLIKNEIENYDFEVLDATTTVETGDSGLINAPSVDLEGVTVDVVKVKRSIAKNETERLDLEVSNPEYRKARRTAQEQRAKDNETLITSQSSMQGGPNTLTFSGASNAESGSPLVIPFELKQSHIEDEAGNIRVNEFVISYDVDPYHKEIGGASDSGHEHDVLSQTTDPSAVDTEYDQGSLFDSSVDDGVTKTIDTSLGFVSGDTDITLATVTVFVTNINSSTNGWDFFMNNQTTGETYYDISNWIAGDVIFASSSSDPFGFRAGTFIIDGDIEGDTLQVGVINQTGSTEEVRMTVSYAQMAEHTHGIPEVANRADTDFAQVSIGDSTSDDASVDATEVDIYLDYWNGSSWTNKNTISNTGKTLDRNVDISSGGTYPDNTGLWRVRVDPNANTADYVQAIVKLKHHIDS